MADRTYEEEVFWGSEETEPVVTGIKGLAMAYADSRGEPGRRLKWRSKDWVELERAEDEFFAAGVDSYNEFSPDLLPRIREYVGNVFVQPAREGSPAVYVKIGHPIEIKHLEQMKHDLLIDMVSVQPDGTLRLWWD